MVGWWNILSTAIVTRNAYLWWTDDIVAPTSDPGSSDLSAWVTQRLVCCRKARGALYFKRQMIHECTRLPHAGVRQLGQDDYATIGEPFAKEKHIPRYVT